MVILFARGGRGEGLWGGCGERSQGTLLRAGAVRAGGGILSPTGEVSVAWTTAASPSHGLCLRRSSTLPQLRLVYINSTGPWCRVLSCIATSQASALHHHVR